jgi:hypothetical protein
MKHPDKMSARELRLVAKAAKRVLEKLESNRAISSCHVCARVYGELSDAMKDVAEGE